MDVIYYVLLGIFGGLIAGLFGVGGGVIIVPVLSVLFKAQGMAESSYVHIAIGTSLATIVVTSVASMRAHHRHGAVRWDLFRQLTPSIAIGALAGAVAAKSLPTPALRIVFGVFELAVALQVGLNLAASPHRHLPGPAVTAACGLVIGLVSSIVGIGGGAMTVPFLIWCNVSIRQAVATSSACGLPISVAGAAGFVLTGWNQPDLPSGSTGYLYWPAFAGIVAASLLCAPLGARLTHVLPMPVLRRMFAVLLGIFGLKMLLG